MDEERVRQAAEDLASPDKAELREAWEASPEDFMKRFDRYWLGWNDALDSLMEELGLGADAGSGRGE